MRRLYIIIKGEIRTQHHWQKEQMILYYWKRSVENTKANWFHLLHFIIKHCFCACSCASWKCCGFFYVADVTGIYADNFSQLFLCEVLFQTLLLYAFSKFAVIKPNIYRYPPSIYYIVIVCHIVICYNSVVVILWYGIRHWKRARSIPQKECWQMEFWHSKKLQNMQDFRLMR